MINYEETANIIVYGNEQEQAQIFSRAYFKLWEILETGVLKGLEDRDLSIGCVAEGPGGFIHALVDYRLRQQRGALKFHKDTYNAITLKIDNNTRNAKDWSDRRAHDLFVQLRKTGVKIQLSYGQTGTGDLLRAENIEYFANEVQQKCQLVTGDGGIECIGDREFEYQEVFNAKLFFGEIVTALHIQEEGGKFILKIYDCGFDLTRQLIMLLALYYDRVQIIKPITSRPGNSEKYLLCESFKGITA
jgi:23S rRNA U2552 (ribose-2'-O)-methylase RlmE/FtsJ